uniref:CSC1/OSCA1-like 7TM region domain-containing protein n=1 Tax=Guillardia theta TaxID=55529 RepID=A0A7S4JBQ9_GUITH|mmetsp:Transcript_14940/g.50628  ORF Transcript_14940/g.50628 Transcript_14940/m.50628 type:complete len:777 (+) Transcript_14940:120-2450(+)
MIGPWGGSWHSVMINFGLHLVLYFLIFAAACFFAARNYRRRRNPERRPLASSEDKAVSGSEEDVVDEGCCQELGTFVADPVPFLVDTAQADDDTVHHLAGLEARLYLDFTWSMTVFFSVIAFLGVAVLVPMNLLTTKKSWYPLDSFVITTSNGFASPSSALLFHTMVAVFLAGSLCAIVYFLRTRMVANAKGEYGEGAIPPVQAYTVEIQGLRLIPPVRQEELRTMFDACPDTQGKVLDVSVSLDVTDLVDLVENHRVLHKKLARYKQQAENDGTRPQMQTGFFSFMYMGEWVDAIDHLEGDLKKAEEEMNALQRKKERMGTGTAFVVFKDRKSAIAAVNAFRNVQKAQSEFSQPAIGRKMQLCRSAQSWSITMACKPEDVFWRNLRYGRIHHFMLSFTWTLILFVALSSIVTPIFLLQLFLAIGDKTIENVESIENSATSRSSGSYESYFAVSSTQSRFNRIVLFFANILWPFLVLLVNVILMPYMVHASVKFFGHRQVSTMRRSSFNLIFFFMVSNLLLVPALSLSGLDELFNVIFSTPVDQLFAQILLYGSSTSFFVEYVAQAAFLSASFYFLFHTTTPALINWASDGHEQELSWEFDFAFFYSSMISVLAIGIMFAVTVPLILPFIAGFLVLRYYTDKWQLLTAHSKFRVDPSPEVTTSAALFALVLISGIALLAFGCWLRVQGAELLSYAPLAGFFVIILILLIPMLRDNLIVVNPRWEPHEVEDVEQPESLEVAAPQAYVGAYENPYLRDSPAATERLWSSGTVGGFAEY